MGPGSVRHIKTLVPAVIATLGDSKVQIVFCKEFRCIFISYRPRFGKILPSATDL